MDELTFKDLAAQLRKLTDYSPIQDSRKLCILRDKPSWIWDEKLHSQLYSEEVLPDLATIIH